MIRGTPVILNYETNHFTIRSDKAEEKCFTKFFLDSSFPREGKAVLTVEETSGPAGKTVQLRVPRWSADFRANTPEKEYLATAADSLLTISRAWKKGDQIKISFSIKVETIPGGVSYPGYTAFKRGPQVLALDENLIKATPGPYTLLKSVTNLPPAQLDPNKKWFGSQAYRLPVLSSTAPARILVPYADASQTGGFSRVWLKDSPGE